MRESTTTVNLQHQGGLRPVVVCKRSARAVMLSWVCCHRSDAAGGASVAVPAATEAPDFGGAAMHRVSSPLLATAGLSDALRKSRPRSSPKPPLGNLEPHQGTTTPHVPSVTPALEVLEMEFIKAFCTMSRSSFIQPAALRLPDADRPTRC